MKKFCVFILLIFLMGSCSPQQRIAKLVKKHPHLLKSIKTDVRIIDTFLIEKMKIIPGKDFTFSVEKDTILKIEKDSIFIKEKTVRIVSPKDTIFMKDTFYLDKFYPVEGKSILIEPPWWQKFTVGFIVCSFLASIIFRLSK
jgi:hypothetical protein